MAIITEKILDFSRGVTNEIRTPDSRFASMVKNFDIHTYQKKLVPLRSTEAGDADATTILGVRNFCIAKLNTTPTYALYGLARDSANSRAEVFYKNISVGSANDLDDDNWTSTANNLETTGTAMNDTDYNLFVFYEKAGLIYGARDKQYVWAYDPDGGTAFAGTAKDLGAYTNIQQGLVHSKDDILYVPYDNKIAKFDNSTWTAPALTLPAHLKINSISEYGNYLAIACGPISGFGKSVVYLWDRDATLTTLSESIDWGEGELFVLEEIEGVLIGISNVGKGASFNNRLVFRYLNGNKATVFNELLSQEVTSGLTSIYAKYKQNNYLYFVFGMTFYDGTAQLGIWKLGKNKEGNFALSFDRTLRNDATGITITKFYGLIVVGDFLFFTYDDSGTITVRKTIEKSGTDEFVATSIYETIILNGEDSSKTKKLLSVTVLTEPLPAAGQIVLKYKKDEDIDGNTFTTILTHTTDDVIRHTAVNIESSGANLPQYKELIFRIESTGGSVVTGLKWKWEEVKDDIID